MLVDHLANLEKRLRSWSDAETATPSDLLSSEFCEPMFGSELSVSAGRIVDCDSTPEAQLAEADILLCRPHGPRLEIDGLGECLLAESVVAAITVLPRLDLDAMGAAVSRARTIKTLRRSGLLPAGASLAEPADPAALDDAVRAIPCYIVAFDGPSDMAQAHLWLKGAYRVQGIVEPDLPDSGEGRRRFASPAVDGVFVIGRGHLNFDNTPLGYFDDESRRAAFGACWSMASTDNGSLMSLFVQITLAAAVLAGMRLDPRRYMARLPAATVRLGN